jgi:hypothetical protein
MPVTLWYEGENWAAHIHQEIPVPETCTMLQKVVVADLHTGGCAPPL